MNLIEVNSVTKRYAAHTALDNVSLNVKEGSIFGLLGPNGAGKTTLIRIINHITAPDQGEVMFNGHPLVQDDVAHIGYLPEERGLYKKMKVGEQAVFFARLKGLSKHDATTQIKEWFEKFDIMPWWNKKIEELSKGMAQKVQFIITVLHRPKLLIFDEPFSGFDPLNADLLKNEILDLRRQGATIIFSTHNMASVEVLCDEITLINKAHNILSGNVEEIRRQNSQGSFMLHFTGDPTKILPALDGLIESHQLLPPDHQGIAMSVKLLPDANLRQVIDAANKAVDLTGFNQLIPSMDDIFISTVKHYNQSQL